ncbi:hypothetical protein L9F63_008505, partial [Diploptera punctata]
FWNLSPWTESNAEPLQFPIITVRAIFCSNIQRAWKLMFGDSSVSGIEIQVCTSKTLNKGPDILVVWIPYLSSPYLL